QVVLPPRNRRLERDQGGRARGRRVPDAAGGVVVVTAPEVAALHLETDFGVVSAGHVARRDIEALAGQPIVEVEAGGRAVRKVAGRLLGDRDAARRQRALARAEADLIRIELDRVGAATRGHTG